MFHQSKFGKLGNELSNEHHRNEQIKSMNKKSNEHCLIHKIIITQNNHLKPLSGFVFIKDLLQHNFFLEHKTVQVATSR